MQASGDGRSTGQWGGQRGLLDNEHAIWMGDLNYRLTISDDKVLYISLSLVCIKARMLSHRALSVMYDK